MKFWIIGLQKLLLKSLIIHIIMEISIVHKSGISVVAYLRVLLAKNSEKWAPKSEAEFQFSGLT